MKTFTKTFLIPVFIFFSFSMLLQAQTDNRNGEIETKGQIQSISSDSIVVNTITFKVDANTVVKNNMGTIIQYSHLQVGMFVEVEAVVQSDSSFLAKIIKMHTEQDNLEIEGFVHSIGGDSLVVNDVTVFVDGNTVISGEEDSLKTFSDIHEGNFVKVKAVRLAGDTLLAVRIKIHTGNSQDKIEIEGTINHINQDTLVVNNFHVVVDANTEIFSKNHDRLNTADLQVGMRVEIKAQLISGNIYLAKRIKVKVAETEEFEFKAVIDSLENGSILLNGNWVKTDSTTEILGQNHIQKTFADLTQGMKIKVEGKILSDNSLFATRIVIREIWNEDVEVTGLIDSIGADWISVMNHTFYINGLSQLFNFDGTSININFLIQGTKVKIKGERSGDSLYVKSLVIVSSSLNKIYGNIDSLSVNTLYVSGIKVKTNSNTIVINFMDSVVTLNDLAVNQTVEMLALLQSDSSYLALIINIEEDPNVTKVSGFVNNITQNSLSVALPLFTVTPNTVVLNSNYQPISFSDLSTGQQVTVWGNQISPSQVEAVQIVANTGIVTGIEDVKNKVTIPNNFSLSQNYPNPFNPSTTIRYTLSKSSYVTLKVYNILGKEVATLVNEQKPSGTFEVTFTANNLASGVYFYSLRAGNFVSTKKLILMK